MQIGTGDDVMGGRGAPSDQTMIKLDQGRKETVFQKHLRGKCIGIGD